MRFCNLVRTALVVTWIASSNALFCAGCLTEQPPSEPSAVSEATLSSVCSTDVAGQIAGELAGLGDGCRDSFLRISLWCHWWIIEAGYTERPIYDAKDAWRHFSERRDCASAVRGMRNSCENAQGRAVDVAALAERICR